MIESVIIITTLALDSGAPGPDQPPTSPPAVVVLDDLENLYEPVRFDHLGHAGMAAMGDGCAACHHFTPEATPHPACRSCHAIGAPESPTMPGLKGAYHRQCLACHTEWDHREACNVCHRAKTDASPIERALFDADSLGVLASPARMTTTLRSTPTAPAFALARRDHTHFFGQRCADCHSGESCANCHDHDAAASATSTHAGARAQCLGCHQTDNGHSCRACHDAAAHPETFDHAAEVGWPLEPYHAELTCANCHGAADTFGTPSPTCCGCHAESSVAGFDHRAAEGERACGDCHRAAASMASSASFGHPAVEGGCVVCHDPIASAEPAYLCQTEPRLCISCHEDVDRCLRDATVRHGSGEDGHRCSTCHQPHGSNHPRLLRSEDSDLCLECHNRSMPANDGRPLTDIAALLDESRFRHGPLYEEDCTVCHQPHGGEHARLLREAFPSAFYASLTEHTYDLCFGCHDDDALLSTATDTLDTGFRNGPTNLHALHVDRRRGRTCRACHDPHASNLPFLIRENVPYEHGLWSFPMGFELSPDGGRCAPACHAPMQYRRTADSTQPGWGATTP